MKYFIKLLFIYCIYYNCTLSNFYTIYKKFLPCTRVASKIILILFDLFKKNRRRRDVAISRIDGRHLHESRFAGCKLRGTAKRLRLTPARGYETGKRPLRSANDPQKRPPSLKTVNRT